MPRDHIAYRYEIRSVFGRGAFGQVLRCLDYKTKDFVALKIVINTAQMQIQGRAEMEILGDLNADGGSPHVLKMIQTFVFRGHVCGVFEILGPNLYELSRHNAFRPLPLADVKRVAKDILEALAFTHAHNIVHCDLKPENVLVVPNRTPLSVRVIDYGSSCRVGQKHFEYIQSRFYRAPEVILGIEYGPPMDIWSFACSIAELVIGNPLFSGNSEEMVLKQHIEMFGPPPPSLVVSAPRKTRFFDSSGNMRQKIGKGKPLGQAGKIQDPVLVDLLTKCMEWDQSKRITASEALRHAYFTECQVEIIVNESPKRLGRPAKKSGQSPPRNKITGPEIALPSLPVPPGTQIAPAPVVAKRKDSPPPPGLKRGTSPPPAALQRKVSPPPTGFKKGISPPASPSKIPGKARQAGMKAAKKSIDSPRRGVAQNAGNLVVTM
jgi:dual specificity tyrosine-phosphorylation-regulated kinase 2/3/4